MRTFDVFYQRLAPHVLSLMRIVVAAAFLEHGLMKLFGFPGPLHMPAFAVMPPLMSVGGTLETVGGLLLLVGLAVRPTAFILSGEMAVAYFLVHAPHGFLPMVNKGELAVVYCFIFLYLAVAGGGRWALDALIRRPQPKREVRKLADAV